MNNKANKSYITLTAYWTKKIIKKNSPQILIDLYNSIRNIGIKIPNSKIYVKHIYKKNGIEIGGPSTVFKYTLPLYNKISSLDGVNFSSSTIWEGNLKTGKNYAYHKNKRGIQYISDATDLSQIEDEKYDFLLSSNCLEHVANPVKALFEFKRIIKKNGSIILVLPNKISNFDHKRPTTQLKHLIEDFQNNVSENDMTHFHEIMLLHDLSMDKEAGDFQNFKERSLDNFKNRALHHHIFDINLLEQMADYAGLTRITTTTTNKNFYILAKK